MNPVENRLISMIALGEGWHNYHHAFPSDYRAAEYGVRYSVTTFVIDVLAFLGLVYDLKEVKGDVVKTRVVKKGDGSHPMFSNQSEAEVDPADLLNSPEFDDKTNLEISARHVTASG